MRKRIGLLFFLSVLLSLIVSCSGDVKTPTDNNPKDPEYQVLYVIEGNIEETDTIVKGSLIEDPYTPTKDYYKFYGWYKDSSYTTLWDFTNDKVDEHIVLYGRWELIGVKFVNEKGDYYIWSDEDSKLVEYCLDGVVRRTHWVYGTYESYGHEYEYVEYEITPGTLVSPVDKDKKDFNRYSDLISQTELYFFIIHGLFTRVDE